MDSDNPTGADNQQERPSLEQWAVGFVDGEERPLRTAKRYDFERFARVLQFMQAGAHLTEDGLRAIANVTEAMNRRQRSRYLESSEAIRQPTLTD